jgi:radical SAM-linked protein
MRLFQRAFKRSGYHLKHTQGFNPRPSVSIALPLSVGVESHCELLDFELEDQVVTCAEILDRLNHNLIDGVKVIDVYENGNKLKYLRYLQCQIDLVYDQGIPDSLENAINELFQCSELWMDKKSKNGITPQNIIPMIRSIKTQCLNNTTMRIHGIVCCQEPTLNPAQLSGAVIKYIPEGTPNFVQYRRCELLDINNKIFR